MKIGIVNNRMGNFGSVISAFEFYRQDVVMLDSPASLCSVDLIILAGVGNFPTAAARLKETGFWDGLNEAVLVRKQPLLGICLGMQLFATRSCENGETRGFGWIPGDVVKIDDPTVRSPHMGWDDVVPNDPELFANIRSNSFYFMHGYHFIPDDPAVVISTTSYGGSNIASAVRKDNIIGVQFHPEKSQGDGMRFLRNCLEIAK
jgi:imidazole glycerol-phosphate synthase subunit HisH